MQHFNTIEDMKKAISCEWFDESDIVVKNESNYDERLGYSTAMVCVKRFGDENYIELYNCPQCIGRIEIEKENNND